MASRRGRQMSVLVIPDDGSRTLEFKVGYWQLRGALGALVVLLVLVVVGGVFYWQSQYWERTSQVLRQENRRLRTEVERVEHLAQTVAEMKQVDQQLRHMLSPSMNLPPPAYSAPPSSRALMDKTEMPAQVSMILAPVDSRVQVSLDPRWMPSIWPVPRSLGWVTAEFVERSGVLQKKHLGIDIAASEGTVVLAAADGKVIFAGVDAVLGQVVAIDHYGAFMTRYGHNSAVLVSQGELVRKGQPIAQVGNSGRSSGPHLHYEILESGRPRNPRLFLPD